MLSIWLYETTGNGLFEGRLFRAGGAALLSIFLVMIFMPKFIRFLQNLDATSDFEEDPNTKATPILGGLLLVIVTIISSLVFAQMNSYVVSTLIILVLYATVGAIDDIAKIYNKRLAAKGLLSKADYMAKADGISATLRLTLYFTFSLIVAVFAYKFIPELKGYLHVPFIKPETWSPYLPNYLFIPFISFVITATANGTNFTDGLDSLVSVPIITSMIFIGCVAYLCGNTIFADYLSISYLPGVDELFPVATGVIGAFLAYLWFNSPPAEIYLGDAGSIGFGGMIGIMFILIQAELFIPIIGVIIIAESLSVVIQIASFKLTGKRVFLCAPLHHHFQFKWKNKFGNKSMLNSKIVWRFHMVSLIALIFGLTIFFKVN